MSNKSLGAVILILLFGIFAIAGINSYHDKAFDLSLFGNSVGAQAESSEVSSVQNN